MSPAGALIAQLSERGHTVATAESLTGGQLAALFTAVPGASAAYVGGVVAYATEVKLGILQIPASVIDTHGVVSAPCAEAMAAAVRGLCHSTYGMATTGVAGPGLQDGHPVGTAFVAIASGAGVVSEQLSLEGDRSDIQAASCAHALQLLARVIGAPPSALG